MPRRGDAPADLQKFATARETRASASLASRNSLSPTSADDLTPKARRTTRSVREIESSPTPKGNGMNGFDGADSADEEEGGDGADEEEDNIGEEDEPSVYASSGLASKKHGHQTGLSISLSNASLSNGINGRKRSMTGSSTGVEEWDLAKKTRKASNGSEHAPTSDDDDDYNAVDDISDSDGEEPDVEKLEERLIIDSEANQVDDFVVQDLRGDSSDEWPGLDETPFADPHSLDLFANAMIERYYSPSPAPAIRRVRFVEEIQQDSSSSSSSDDSEIDTSIFPDLFMEKDQLEAGIRQIIEGDEDDESMTDGEGSYWDLNHNEDFDLEQHGLEDDSEEQILEESSGYETDEGETTDEEVLPPMTVHRPQSVLRLDSETPKSTPARTPRRPLPSSGSKNKGPLVGSWVADPTKPYVVFAGNGKRLILMRPSQSASKAITAPPSSVAASPSTPYATLGRHISLGESENEASETTPMGTDRGDIMMSGLLNGNLGGEILGPPEAFYKFQSINANGVIEEDDEYDYDDDDDEDLLNIADFIDFGDDSSEAEEQDCNNEDEDSEGVALKDPLLSTPATKSPSNSLLEHFDRGVVSSFRRNQNRHTNLLRRPNTNHTLYAIKGGRHIVANAPITPMRKRKASRSVSQMNVTPTNNLKRKLSSAQLQPTNRHKRSKSTV